MRDKLTILYHYLHTRHLIKRLNSHEALLTWQQKRLRHFMRHVLVHSPFYQPYIGQPLASYPIMDKALMMEHFDRINTAGVNKKQALEVAARAELSRDFSSMIGNISIGLSSGTSGSRGLFIASKKERLMWAGIILAKALGRSLWRKQKIAFFLRADNQLYQTLNLGHHIKFQFFDLMIDLESHIRALNQLQPSILVAPASMLKLLAISQRQGLLKITPQKIISVAETLDKTDQSFISASFGQIIHQIYQCTEGFLAITDQYGVLRMNEELVHIEKEWIDQKNGRFIPIITDFTRISQPIVRYRLNDILVQEDNNGVMTVLSRIEGRCDDLCTLPSLHDKVHEKPLFADYISRAIISVIDETQDYAVTQTGKASFTISIIPQANAILQDKIATAFNDLAAQLQCVTPQLHFTSQHSHYSPVKLRRIQNHYKKRVAL